jgi:hypothetical protein
MATSFNITLTADADGLRAAAAAIGIRPTIKAARVAMPYPDVKAAPLRRFVSIACTMEVQHAKADFWRLAHELKAASLFDSHVEPDADTGFRLPHEARAGEALIWLSHLQAHDSDRHGPWSRWGYLSLEGKRRWMQERRRILHGLLKAAAAYRAARASTEGGR